MPNAEHKSGGICHHFFAIVGDDAHIVPIGTVFRADVPQSAHTGIFRTFRRGRCPHRPVPFFRADVGIRPYECFCTLRRGRCPHRPVGFHFGRMCLNPPMQIHPPRKRTSCRSRMSSFCCFTSAVFYAPTLITMRSSKYMLLMLPARLVSFHQSPILI